MHASKVVSSWARVGAASSILIAALSACGGSSGSDPAPKCASDAACADGDLCNGVERCDPAVGCIAGTALACDDGSLCNGVESCDVALGCQAGTPLLCNDNYACNGVETCDPLTGCVAGSPLVCDDGDACNGIEWCETMAGCLPGTPPTCDDGDPCNGYETCDPGTGCQPGGALVTVDTLDRQRVKDFYRCVYLPVGRVESGWNAGATSCDPGVLSPAFKTAALSRVNYFRAMSGFQVPVTLDAGLTTNAQAGAVMAQASAKTTGYTTGDACYTAPALASLVNSAVLVDASVTPQVVDRLVETAGGAPFVPHRMVLEPRLTTAGIGSTEQYFALDARSGMGARPADPTWVAWPPAGYVPAPLAYYHWTVMAPAISGAGSYPVTMTRAGNPVTVQNPGVTSSGTGDPIIYWHPVLFNGPAGVDQTYRVTIGNFFGAGQSLVYDVTLIDPAPRVTGVTPSERSNLMGRSAIVVDFDQEMNPASLVVGGTLTAGGTSSTWPTPKQLRIVHLASEWPAGEGLTLTVSARDTSGDLMAPLVLTYDACIFHVNNSAANASDLNDGSPRRPLENPWAAQDNVAYGGGMCGGPLAGQIRVAGGSYVVDSGAGTHIRLGAYGWRLLGGYSPTNWTFRNRTVYPTFIRNSPTGTPPVPDRTVEIAAGDLTVIDGFVFDTLSTGENCTILITGGRPVISSNIVWGGPGALLNRGVCIIGIAQPTLSRNEIVGSHSNNPGPAIGVQCDGTSGSATPTILQNSIESHRGNPASGDQIGISISSCGGVIERNRITAGTTQSGSALISTGLRILPTPVVAPNVYNNVIKGGDSPNSRGIHVDGSAPGVFNNTILTGDLVSSPENSNVVVLLGDGGLPQLGNNLFVGRGGAADYCVVESAADSDPGLMNNDFAGCPGKLYYDNDSGRTFDQICGGTPGSHSAVPALDCVNRLTTPTGINNVAVDPLLDAITSAPTASTSTAITNGGIDLSGIFTVDLNSAPRTLPWSMGAYEKD